MSLNSFGVTVNCVTVIKFSSQYILLLLNWLVLQWIVWLLFSSDLNTYCYCSTDWYCSELCDCYSVQFSIYTVIAQLIGVTVNCVTVIEFSSQYILLLLNRLVLQWIVWLLFSSVLNTYCYCSTHLVLQWIVWLLISSVLNTYCYCSTDWCYSELCVCYSVLFSIHTVIAQLIRCYSELCDCYSVQF